MCAVAGTSTANNNCLLIIWNALEIGLIAAQGRKPPYAYHPNYTAELFNKSDEPWQIDYKMTVVFIGRDTCAPRTKRRR